MELILFLTFSLNSQEFLKFVAKRAKSKINEIIHSDTIRRLNNASEIDLKMYRFGNKLGKVLNFVHKGNKIDVSSKKPCLDVCSDCLYSIDPGVGGAYSILLHAVFYSKYKLRNTKFPIF